jgi:DHA2 family multidrug resistance protein
VEHLTPYDPTFTQSLDASRHYMGLDPIEAAGLVYRAMQQQAGYMAYVDVFHVQAMLFFGLAVFMWILRRPDHGGHMPEGVH